jgi:hypothetical protein
MMIQFVALAGLSLPCHHLLELVPLFMRIGTGRLLPSLCSTVPFTNPGTVHILDEGLQLMVEVFLHVDDDVLHLAQNDGLPGQDDVFGKDIDQGCITSCCILMLEF